MSLFQKIFQGFLKRFFVTMGREPQNPAEWMQIQNQAVRHLNKTKGAPPIKKEPWHQGWNPKIVGEEKTRMDKIEEASQNLGNVMKESEKITIDDLLKGPVKSQGIKGDRIWDFSQKRQCRRRLF